MDRILAAILGALIIIGVLSFILIRKKKTPPDYYIFFIMGVIWLPAGVAIKNYAFSVMGLIFMIVGLVNKDKWEKNRRRWSNMDKDERKLMGIIIGTLLILVILGLIVFYLTSKNAKIF